MFQAGGEEPGHVLLPEKVVPKRAAVAQPASTGKPVAVQPGSAAKATSDTSKKAISKACSDQATAKGLHGKERKAFRSECKKNGGKPA